MSCGHIWSDWKWDGEEYYRQCSYCGRTEWDS